MSRHSISLTFLFFFVLFSSFLSAQAPANDACSGATVISDPSDFCTGTTESNSLASPSIQAFPSCWSNVGADLWYTFTAVSTDLKISLKGQTPTNPTGTLFGPEVAVYSGDCNNLTEIACYFDLNFSNNLVLSISTLVVGQQYFIRVDGVIPGAFEFCIKNKEFPQLNDECNTAQVISDPSNFCTDVDEADNTLGTPSIQPLPSCWFNGGADLWYSFTAVATELLVIVKGQTPSNPGGTLLRPQIALYGGDCNNLVELGCSADNFGTNNQPLFATDLVVGQQYFIRIDGLFPGFFQCCVKNTETLDVVSSDCPTGTFICSKKPIHIEQVFGPGDDPNEVNTAPCFSGTGESSSAWFIFTAANNGNLEFTLTPNDPADDLDFIVYRLPNGPGNCNGKIIERCMGAGDFSPTSPCMGPTGLNATATDISQPFGCVPGMDNWLRFLPLVSGQTYALVVNDFTSIGNGFSVEWGGTALFQGATTAKFVTDEPDKKICLGEELIVTDSSFTTDGIITSWDWNFDTGAVADSTTGQGPISVQYQIAGPKMILLTVKNEEGCASQDTAFLLVENCCTLEAEVSVQTGCPNAPAATATVTVQNGIEPLNVQWSNGQTGPSSTFNTSGDYSVLVEDAGGCQDSLTFHVDPPLNVGVTFPRDSSILEGETLSLSVTATPANNLTVWWIGPAGDTLSGAGVMLSPKETTTYFVVADNNGCIFTDSVTIEVKKTKYAIPNAFTPNGDGSNDAFGPVLEGHTLLHLEVWSRWGEKIFDSVIEGKTTWDGAINGVPAPSDVYVYRMRVLLNTGEEKLDTGDVTLLR